MNILASLLALVSVTAAAALPLEQINTGLAAIEQRDPQADGACTNGALTRQCWSDGYSIATDFDQKHPTTGVTVSYHLTITNTTCNQDGNGDKLCMLINGQYPGPLITANWGDMLEITVENQLQDNGTAMHWHGVRMLNSVGSDGVPGITQCPIAPGQSYTYKFQATQFGTSWYHSHFSNQYGDGVVGPIVFNGPASSNYDVDLGPYALTDWYYETAFQGSAQSFTSLQTLGGPPAADNILVNGTNKNFNGGGSYNKVTMTKGKKYRLRLINMSVNMFMRVSLDNHTMTVMTSDFVPIKPFAAQTLLVGIGQRYDVVISANQTAGNYWFRAEPAADCFDSTNNNMVGKAVWSYSGVTVADPVSMAWPTASSACLEPSNLAPYWVQAVPSGSFNEVAGRLDVNITTGQILPNQDTVVVWAINNTNLNVNWSMPTVSYVFDDNTDYAENMNVIPTVSEGSWNYYLIQQFSTAPPIPHPIHLHGHDYFVLGQGTSVWDGTAALNFATPPRRDTAVVPGGGWLAIAFPSNNPGTWLMHCHIAFHIGEGLGMQFMEQPSSIVLPDSGSYDAVCDAWREYATDGEMYYPKSDSGL